jgi:prevent-host-death family protein
MQWQLQEAKQRFSELVRRAEKDGPQVVTRHGDEVVVVLSAEDFHRLKGDTVSFRDFLLAGPPTDDLEIERDRSVGRPVSLGDA